MRADLHLHSEASDGLYAPEKLMRACAGAGMTLVALTDHDTLSGLPEAARAARELGIGLLPGIEISVQSGEYEVHLLGYGIRPPAEPLADFLRQMRQDREQRVRKIIGKLNELGLPLRYEDVRGLAKDILSRSHVALQLVRQGMVESTSEAFARYLSPGRPAYVPRRHIPVGEAAALLHSVGAVAVLAHPGQLPLQDMELRARILGWQAEGLDGIEVYHPSHSEGQIRWLHQIARQAGLLVTGGSDFHAPEMRSAAIGQMLPRWGEECAGDIDALRRAIGRRAEQLIGKDAPASFEEE